MKYKLIEGSANNTYDIIGTVLKNRGVENSDEYLSLNVFHCNDYRNLENIDDAVTCFTTHFERGDAFWILVDPDI